MQLHYDSVTFTFSLLQVCERTVRQGARAGRVVTDEPVTGWRITIRQGTHQSPVTHGRRTDEDQVCRGACLRRKVCIESVTLISAARAAFVTKSSTSTLISTTYAPREVPFHTL